MDNLTHLNTSKNRERIYPGVGGAIPFKKRPSAASQKVLEIKDDIIDILYQEAMDNLDNIKIFFDKVSQVNDIMQSTQIPYAEAEYIYKLFLKKITNELFSGK